MRAEIPRRFADLFRPFSRAKYVCVGAPAGRLRGSEHQLLADVRFANLRVGVLVMEWHTTDSAPRAEADSIMCLEAAGYEVESGTPQDDGTGMLWARRRRPVDFELLQPVPSSAKARPETRNGG